MSVDVMDRPTGHDPQPVVQEREAVDLSTEGMTNRVEQAITAFIVGVPFVVLVFGVVWFWGEGIHLRDIVLAVVLYFVAGHGVTVGFHRLLAHKSFRAPTAEVGAGRRRVDGVRGRADRLGRRPSPAPRLLRPAR